MKRTATTHGTGLQLCVASNEGASAKDAGEAGEGPIGRLAEWIAQFGPSEKSKKTVMKVQSKVVPICKVVLQFGWVPFLLFVGLTEVYSGPRFDFNKRYGADSMPRLLRRTEPPLPDVHSGIHALSCKSSS
eukprot:g67117.t1